ncbi:uncharacterized protein BJ212DRAFT_1413080 [Suillus subaureus]|uniref:Glutathione S-transferase UstS-like C-terminal domain-containing protein n=1 Tax=Suillus subaureus TaxID=48587 RepID=A0A9P7AQV6_9AGAM|nr:uncharacterized protein BJ212DRAFT_1413080 [Suillus subaureus]KAG1794300.1 hypothetical protein BJ212DRAFT_1413080 [Suillus subaureus]
MGDTFSYADIIVACWLLALKRVLKENDEWARISFLEWGKMGPSPCRCEKECKLA